MLNKAINFIKYNNATVLILAIIFIAGTGAFAQTETGQEIIGQKETRIEGIDNTLLLAADLDNMNMDFRIEKIEQDDKYYFVTYTYIDLIKLNSAWQYQINEKQRKVSKKLKEDLGVYLAKELAEEYEARIKDLKKEQSRAKEQGKEVRIEVIEYSGLIGQTLDFTGRIFPGYEPIKIKEIPTPDILLTLPFLGLEQTESDQVISPADNLTEVYNDYIAENDPDKDDVFGADDNCPAIYNTDQLDSDNDGLGDVCDLTVESEADEQIATSTDSEADVAVEEIDNIEEPAEENLSEEESVEIELTEEPEENVVEEEAAEEEVVESVEEPAGEVEVEIIELPE